MAPIVTLSQRQWNAAEIVEEIALSGKRAIVTGAASGIGVETARALAHAGAEVTLAVRNIGAGAQTAADITATTRNPNIHVALLDLSDRGSITKFVAECGRNPCVYSPDPVFLHRNNKHDNEATFSSGVVRSVV